MAVTTSQMPLPLLPGQVVPIGTAAGLIEGPAGGLVFLHGVAIFAWDEGDAGARRWAAVQLIRIKAAKRLEVAAGFGVLDPGVVAVGTGRVRRRPGRGRASQARTEGRLETDSGGGGPHP